MTEAEIEALVRAARQIRERAYAPYSNYHVGAALLSEGGRVFTGVNVENSAYPTSMCAERNALATAVGAGQRRFRAVAIVTAVDDQGRPGTPCGACRQALWEFAPKLEVILAGPEGDARSIHSLAALLPDAFGPERL